MNGTQPSHLLPIFTGAALLIGSATLNATTSTPPSYEPAITLTAATLLDESVATSEHYRIEPEVANDGRMNSYQLSSEIQSLEVHTDSLLRERAHEIEAIVALRQMKESDTFQKGFMAAAEAPISLTRNLVTDPVGTLESIPSGIGNVLSDVGAAISSIGKESSDEDDTLAKNLLGFNTVKRRLAAELGVDPYSSNKLLQEELDDVAWSVFAGGAPIEAVMVAAPMVASVSVRISNGTQSDPNGWKISPTTMLKAADQSAQKIGLSEEESTQLVYHPICSVNHLTRQVAAISILEGALGREALLKSNSGADSEMACRHAQQQAELIYNYHTNRDRVINLHSQDGQLQLVDWSGNKIYPVIADYLTLSESNNGLIEALTRPSTSKRILWLSGRASPQLLSALSKQGIELVEQAQTTPLSVAEILLPERVQEQREAENKGNRTGEIASSIGSTIGSVFDAITPDLGEAEASPEAQ